MSKLDMLQLYLLLQFNDHQPFPAKLCISTLGSYCQKFLDMYFPGHWFQCYGPIVWPQHSPNITALDFLPWGYIKDTVYNTLWRPDEVKLSYTANARENLKANWILLEHLMWNKSCLAFCRIYSRSFKTFLIYIFIFHKQFYFVVSSLKITGHGNLDNNFRSSYISFIYEGVGVRVEEL